MLAAGSAFALGALVAFGRPRGRITGAIAGVLGGMAIGVVRDIAIKKVAGYARHWIDETERKRADDVIMHNRDVEAFYDH